MRAWLKIPRLQDTHPAKRARLAALANGVLNLGMLSVLGQFANRAGLAAVFLVTGILVAASSLALLHDRLKHSSGLRAVIEAEGRD